MPEVESRPLLTREVVEALRRLRVKRYAEPDMMGDLVDTLLAAWDQLGAVDRFAEEIDDVPGITRDDANAYGLVYMAGYAAARRELRALLAALGEG